MKRFLLFMILSFTFLAASCAGSSQEQHPDVKQSHLAPEPTTDQTEHPFWNDPSVDYVSTAWPIDDDDDLVDIRQVPKLEMGFIDPAPADRSDGIRVGELGIDGGNRDMIIKLAREMSDGQHGDFDSLLIAHKGKLLFESYYSLGRINLAHPQASATKTYTSLALGRAIQLGYLTMADLDKPVISFLKELDPEQFVEGAERVTLHQALTMRTGIRISEEHSEAYDKYPDQVEGQKLVQAIFEQSAPITPESQNSFSYGNFGSPLVMQVIDAVVPGSAEDFIKNELLNKLEITGYEWWAGPDGLPAAGRKSSFTSRAMAKFGILAMNKGKWNGEQLISEAFIAKSFSKPVVLGEDEAFFAADSSVSNPGYGYFWWNADLKHGDRHYSSISAQGGSGQYIILIEELDLIVVATGSHRGDSRNLQIAAERIIPAFADAPGNSERRAADQPQAYEMPRTQVVPIVDLGEDRGEVSGADRQYELYIKLPEDYSEQLSIRYPVIYTTDAAWHMDMLSGATEYLMPEVILVGISWQKNLEDERPSVSRFRDYTVEEVSDPELQAQYQPGQASSHLSFLRDKVIPYIESNYRADSAERAYFGYSLGGQFGAYVLLARPDTFKHYILGSPSVRSSEYFDALEQRTALSQKDTTTNVLVSIGQLETEEMENTENFVSLLRRRAKSGLILTGLEIIEGSDHSTGFPETAIRGVKWLSSKQK